MRINIRHFGRHGQCGACARVALIRQRRVGMGIGRIACGAQRWLAAFRGRKSDLRARIRQNVISCGERIQPKVGYFASCRVDVNSECRVAFKGEMTNLTKSGPFNSLGCIASRTDLYWLSVVAEERQDALENKY